MNEHTSNGQAHQNEGRRPKIGARVMASPLTLPLALFLVVLAVNAVFQQNMFDARVVRTNILTFTPLMLVAMGQAIIMISGNLDLSVGWGVSAINCIIATYMTDDPMTIALVLMIALAASICMGLVNGFLIGYLKLPFLIATFASSYVWLGLAMKITPIPGGYFPRFFAKFFKAYIGPFNTMLLIVIVCVVVWGIIRRFRLGRYIFAVGSDSEAAFNNGINVKKITLLAFALGWVFVFLGALMITAQTRNADSQIGTPFALNSIAAAVVGGIALGGGRGSIIGALLGAVVLSLIMNIIYFAGIPGSWQVFVKGMIIIVALGATVIYKKKYD
jgi:ribose transport system permease protein